MRAALHALSAMARGPLWPLLAISGLCWAAIAALMLRSPLVQICGGPVDWETLLAGGGGRGIYPRLGLDLLMLGAMMSPLLAHNLTCVRRQSLAARRTRAAALFILGYLTPWTVALIGLAALSGLLSRALHSGLAALAAALGLGLVWQGAPMKALALRACHRTPALPAFGVRAEFASFAYGLRSAAWCVAACWLWMLAPFTLAADLSP